MPVVTDMKNKSWLISPLNSILFVMLRPPSPFFGMSDYQTAVYSAECHKHYLISCNMFAFVNPQPYFTKGTFKGGRSQVAFPLQLSWTQRYIDKALLEINIKVKSHKQEIWSGYCVFFPSVLKSSSFVSPVALESETKCKCHRVNCVCGLHIWINPSFLLETKWLTCLTDFDIPLGVSCSFFCAAQGPNSRTHRFAHLHLDSSLCKCELVCLWKFFFSLSYVHKKKAIFVKKFIHLFATECVFLMVSWGKTL